MCDTVVVTAEATNDCVPLLGKNSDREPNEAQYVVRVPAADHLPHPCVGLLVGRKAVDASWYEWPVESL